MFIRNNHQQVGVSHFIPQVSRSEYHRSFCVFFGEVALYTNLGSPYEKVLRDLVDANHLGPHLETISGVH